MANEVDPIIIDVGFKEDASIQDVITHLSTVKEKMEDIGDGSKGSTAFLDQLGLTDMGRQEIVNTLGTMITGLSGIGETLTSVPAHLAQSFTVLKSEITGIETLLNNVNGKQKSLVKDSNKGMQSVQQMMMSIAGMSAQSQNVTDFAKAFRGATESSLGWGVNDLARYAPQVVSMVLEPAVRKIQAENKHGIGFNGIVSSIMRDKNNVAYLQNLAKLSGYEDGMSREQVQANYEMMLRGWTPYAMSTGAASKLMDWKARGVYETKPQALRVEDRFTKDANDYQKLIFSGYGKNEYVEKQAAEYIRSQGGSPIRSYTQRRQSGLQELHKFLQQGNNMDELFPLLQEAGIATVNNKGQYQIFNNIREQQLQYLRARALQEYSNALRSDAPYEGNPTDVLSAGRMTGRQGRRPTLYLGLNNALPEEVIPSLAGFDKETMKGYGGRINTGVSIGKTPTLARYYIPQTSIDFGTGKAVVRNNFWQKDLTKGIEQRPDDEQVAITDSLIARMFGMEGDRTLGFGHDEKTGAIRRTKKVVGTDGKTRDVELTPNLFTADFSKFITYDEEKGKYVVDKTHPDYKRAERILSGQELVDYGVNPETGKAEKYRFLYSKDDGRAIFGKESIAQEIEARYAAAHLPSPFKYGNDRENGILFDDNAKTIKQINAMAKMASSGTAIEDLMSPEQANRLKNATGIYANFEMMYDILDDMEKESGGKYTGKWSKIMGRRMDGLAFGDPTIFSKDFQGRFGAGTDKFAMGAYDWRPMLLAGWEAGRKLNSRLYGYDETYDPNYNGPDKAQYEKAHRAIWAPTGGASKEDYAKIRQYISGKGENGQDLTEDELADLRRQYFTNTVAKEAGYIIDRSASKSGSGYRTMSLENFWNGKEGFFTKADYEQALADNRIKNGEVQLLPWQQEKFRREYAALAMPGKSGFIEMKNEGDMFSDKDFIPESVLRGVNAPQEVFEKSERLYKQRLDELNTTAGRIKQFQGDANAMEAIANDPSWVWNDHTAVTHIEQTRRALEARRARHEVLTEGNREGNIAVGTVGQLAEIFQAMTGMSDEDYGQFKSLLPEQMEKNNAVFSKGVSSSVIDMLTRFPFASGQYMMDVNNYAQAAEVDDYLDSLDKLKTTQNRLGKLRRRNDKNYSAQRATRIADLEKDEAELQAKIAGYNERISNGADDQDQALKMAAALKASKRDPRSITSMLMTASQIYSMNTGDFDGDTVNAFIGMSEAFKQNARTELNRVAPEIRRQREAKLREVPLESPEESPFLSKGEGVMESWARASTATQKMAVASAALRKAQSGDPNDPTRVIALAEAMQAYDLATSDVKTKGAEFNLGSYAEKYLYSQGAHYERFIKQLQDNSADGTSTDRGGLFRFSAASTLDPEGVFAMSARHSNAASVETEESRTRRAAYIKSLTDAGLAPDSDEYKQKLANWDVNNRVIKTGIFDLDSYEKMENWYRTNFGAERTEEAKAARFYLDKMEDNLIWGKLWNQEDIDKGNKLIQNWGSSLDARTQAGQNVAEERARFDDFRKRMGEMVDERGIAGTEDNVRKLAERYEKMALEEVDETKSKGYSLYAENLRRMLPESETEEERNSREAFIQTKKHSDYVWAKEVNALTEASKDQTDLDEIVQNTRIGNIVALAKGEGGRSIYNWSNVKHFIGQDQLDGKLFLDGLEKVDLNTGKSSSVAARSVDYYKNADSLNRHMRDMILEASGEKDRTEAYRNPMTHIGQLMHSTFERVKMPQENSVYKTPEEAEAAGLQWMREALLGMTDRDTSGHDMAALRSLGLSFIQDESGNLKAINVGNKHRFSSAELNDYSAIVNNLLGTDDGHGSRSKGFMQRQLEELRAGEAARGEQVLSIEDKLYRDGKEVSNDFGGKIYRRVVTDKDGNIVHSESSLDRDFTQSAYQTKQGEKEHIYETHAKPDYVTIDKNKNLHVYDWKSSEQGALESIPQSMFYANMFTELGKKFHETGDQRYEQFKEWYDSTTGKSTVKTITGVNPQGGGENYNFDATTEAGRAKIAEIVKKVDRGMLTEEALGIAGFQDAWPYLTRIADKREEIGETVKSARQIYESGEAAKAGSTEMDFFLSTYGQNKERLNQLRSDVYKEHNKDTMNEYIPQDRFTRRERELKEMFSQQEIAAVIANAGDSEMINSEIQRIQDTRAELLALNEADAMKAVSGDLESAKTNIRQMLTGVRPTSESNVVFGAVNTLRRAAETKEYLKADKQYVDANGNFRINDENEAIKKVAIARNDAYNQALEDEKEAEVFLTKNLVEYTSKYEKKSATKIDALTREKPLDPTESFQKYVESKQEELQKLIDQYNENVQKYDEEIKNTKDASTKASLQRLQSIDRENAERLQSFVDNGGVTSQAIADQRKKLGLETETPEQQSDRWLNERLAVINAQKEQALDNWFEGTGTKADYEKTLQEERVVRSQAADMKERLTRQREQQLEDYKNTIENKHLTPAEQAERKVNHLRDQMMERRDRLGLNDPMRDKYNAILNDKDAWQAMRNRTQSEIEDARALKQEQSDIRIDQLLRQGDQLKRNRYGQSRSIVARALTQHDQALSQAENYKLSIDQQLAVEQKKLETLPEGTEEYAKAAENIEKLKAASTEAGAAIESLKNPLSTAAAVAGQFGNVIGMAAKRLGRRLFQNVIKETKQFIKQFDASMNEIQTITLKSDEDMASVRSNTVNKALKLRTSVSNVATTEAALYRQGLSDEEVSSRTDSIIKFATVTKLNVSEATKIITTALQNDLVPSAEAAMDALVALGDSAATTAAEIGKGMQKAAASAKVAGVSYAELTALLTIGTSDTQLSGTQVGTALQTVFTRMRRLSLSGYTADQNGEKTSASDAEAALKSVGVDLWDDKATGKMRTAYEVLLDLSRVWQNLNDAQKSIVTNAMAGTRQTNIFSTLMEGMSEDGGETLEKYLGLAEGSEGITQSKYEIAMQSLAASMDTLKSSWDGVVESFTNTGAITGAIDAVSGLLNYISDLSNNGAGIGVAFSAIAAGITGLVTVCLAAKTAVAPISTLLGLIAGAAVGGIGLLATGGLSSLLNPKSKEEILAEQSEADLKINAAKQKNRDSKLSTAQKTIEDVKKLGEAYNESQTMQNEDNLVAGLQRLASAFPEVSASILAAIQDLSKWEEAVNSAEQTGQKYLQQNNRETVAAAVRHMKLYAESEYEASVGKLNSPETKKSANKGLLSYIKDNVYAMWNDNGVIDYDAIHKEATPKAKAKMLFDTYKQNADFKKYTEAYLGSVNPDALSYLKAGKGDNDDEAAPVLAAAFDDMLEDMRSESVIDSIVAGLKYKKDKGNALPGDMYPLINEDGTFNYDAYNAYEHDYNKAYVFRHAYEGSAELQHRVALIEADRKANYTGNPEDYVSLIDALGGDSSYYQKADKTELANIFTDILNEGKVTGYSAEVREASVAFAQGMAKNLPLGIMATDEYDEEFIQKTLLNGLAKTMAENRSDYFDGNGKLNPDAVTTYLTDFLESWISNPRYLQDYIEENAPDDAYSYFVGTGENRKKFTSLDKAMQYVRDNEDYGFTDIEDNNGGKAYQTAEQAVSALRMQTNASTVATDTQEFIRRAKEANSLKELNEKYDTEGTSGVLSSVLSNNSELFGTYLMAQNGQMSYADFQDAVSKMGVGRQGSRADLVESVLQAVQEGSLSVEQLRTEEAYSGVYKTFSSIVGDAADEVLNAIEDGVSNPDAMKSLSKAMVQQRVKEAMQFDEHYEEALSYATTALTGTEVDKLTASANVKTETQSYYDYAAAVQRYASGKATAQDYATIASYDKTFTETELKTQDLGTQVSANQTKYENNIVAKRQAEFDAMLVGAGIVDERGNAAYSQLNQKVTQEQAEKLVQASGLTDKSDSAYWESVSRHMQETTQQQYANRMYGGFSAELGNWLNSDLYEVDSNGRISIKPGKEQEVRKAGLLNYEPIYTNTQLASKSSTLLKSGKSWADIVSGVTTQEELDELEAIKQYSPDLYKYLNMSEEQKASQEGLNLKQKIETQFEVTGTQLLEEAGEIAEGTAAKLEKLQKGGDIAIKVSYEIQSEAYQTAQLGARLNKGTHAEQLEAIKSLTGYSDAQIQKMGFANALSDAQTLFNSQSNLQAASLEEYYKAATTDEERALIDRIAHNAGFVNQYDDRGIMLNGRYRVGSNNVDRESAFTNAQQLWTATQMAQAQQKILNGTLTASTTNREEEYAAAAAKMGEQGTEYMRMLEAGTYSEDELKTQLAKAQAEVGNALIQATEEDLVKSLGLSSDNYTRAHAQEIAQTRTTLSQGTEAEKLSAFSSLAGQSRSLISAQYALTNYTGLESASTISSFLKMDEKDVREALSTEAGRNTLQAAINNETKNMYSLIAQSVTDSFDFNPETGDLSELKTKLEEAANNTTGTARELLLNLANSIDEAGKLIGQSDLSFSDEYNKIMAQFSDAAQKRSGFDWLRENFEKVADKDRTYRDYTDKNGNYIPGGTYPREHSLAEMVQANSVDNPQLAKLLGEHPELVAAMNMYDNGKMNGNQFDAIIDYAQYGRKTAGLTSALTQGLFSGTGFVNEGGMFNLPSTDEEAQKFIKNMKEIQDAGDGTSEMLDILFEQYPDLKEFFESGDKSKAAKALKEINAQMTTDKVNQATKFTKANKNIADAMGKISKGGKDAAAGYAMLRENSRDRTDQMTAAMVGAKDKKGNYKAGNKLSDQTRNVIASAFEDIDADDLKDYTAEQMEELLADLPAYINEQLVDDLNAGIEGMNIPVDLTGIQVDADGNVDLTALKSALDAVDTDIFNTLMQMIIAQGGEWGSVKFKVDDNGNLVVVSADTKFNKSGKYSSGGAGKKSGGGGGKSASQVKIDAAKHYVGEAQHQVNLAEADLYRPDKINDYDAYGGAIATYLYANEQLAHVMRDQIDALEEQRATVSEGSDDWWSLTEAINGYEESLAKLEETMDEIEKKMFEELKEQYTYKLTSQSHEMTMSDVDRTYYQRTNNYEAEAAEIDNKVALEESQIRTYQEYLAKLQGLRDAEFNKNGQSDYWWELQQEIDSVSESIGNLVNEIANLNAEKLNINIEMRTHNLAPVQQEASIMSYDEQILSKQNSYGALMSLYDQQIANNEKQRKIYQDSIKANEELLASQDAESDEWYATLAEIYADQNALLELAVSDRETLAKRIDVITEAYQTVFDELTHRQNMLTTQNETYGFKNDYKAYFENLNSYIVNRRQTEDVIRAYIESLKKEQGNWEEGSDEWNRLQTEINAKEEEAAQIQNDINNVWAQRLDAITEKQEHELTPLKHEQTMLGYQEQTFGRLNDYEGFIDTIDKENESRKNSIATQRDQLAELKAEQALVDKDSDAWWNLQTRINAVTQAIEEDSQAIDANNKKRIEALQQKQQAEDKPQTHAFDVLSVESERADLLDDQEMYEGVVADRLNVIRDAITQNDSQVAEWEDLLGTYVKGSDEWLEVRDNIWAVKLDTAKMENEALKLENALAAKRLANIQKNFKRNTGFATHENTMLDTAGRIYQSYSEYGNYRDVLAGQIDAQAKVRDGAIAARDAILDEMATLEIGSEAWYDARDAAYAYDEQIASTTATMLEKRQAIEASRIQEFTENYNDSQMQNNIDLAAIRAQRQIFERNNDYENYRAYGLKEKEILEQQLADKRFYVEGLKNLLAETTKGTSQWKSLRGTIAQELANIANMEADIDRIDHEQTQSAIDHMLERMNWEDENRQHNLSLIRYEQSKYQNAGELSNYGLMLKQEESIIRDSISAEEENIKKLKETLATLEAGSKEYKQIVGEIKKHEEALVSDTAELKKNNKEQKENRDAILKTQKDVIDVVDKEFRTREEERKKRLDAEVKLQKTILDTIKDRYKDQWELEKKDIDKKKESLEKEKALINERLNARKSAMETEEKYRELEELKRQLALISNDPTRTRDAKELRERINDIEKDISWERAFEEAETATQQIDDEIQAMSDYVTVHSDNLEEMLENANNFSDQIALIMSGGWDSISEFLTTNNKGFLNSTDKARQQMEEDWKGTWETMTGYAKTYWDQIAKILSSYETFVEFMKDSTEYLTESDVGKQILEFGWETLYENWKNGGLISEEAENYQTDDHPWTEGTTTTTVGDILGDMANDWMDLGLDKPAEATKSMIVNDYSDVGLDAKPHAVALTDLETGDTYTGIGITAAEEAAAKEGGESSNKPIGAAEPNLDGEIPAAPTPNLTPADYEATFNYDYSGVGTKYEEEAPSSYAKVYSESPKEYTPTYTPSKKTTTSSNNKNNNNNNGTGQKYYDVYDEKGFKTNYTVLASSATEANEKAKTEIGSYYSSGGTGSNTIPEDTKKAQQKYPGSKLVFKTGGLVDYTGPAWVDGTPSKPEAFLSAIDTEMIKSLTKALNYIRIDPVSLPNSDAFTSNSSTVGDINITINQAELKNDADYEDVARRVGKAFTKELSKNGFNLTGYNL